MRRDQGTGTVEQLPSGRWRVRLTVDGRRQTLGTYLSAEEAGEVLDAAREKLASGAARPVGGSTLRAYGEGWLDDRERAGRRGMASVRSQWRHHVATAPFADLPLSAVTRLQVRDWLRATSRKVSRGSLRLVHGYLRQCFEYAIDDGLVRENPAAFRRERVRRSRESDSETTRAWTYLTLEEQRRLATTDLLPEHSRLLLQFLLYTGLRVGEAVAMRRADVRLDAPAPHLVVRYGSPPAGPTKTGEIRVLPLLPPLQPVLRRWLALCPTGRDNPHGLLWPAPRGGFLAVSHPAGRTREADTWRLVRERLFKRRVRIHDLRHTCASSLVAGWWGRAWSLLEVKEYLGHSSISMTQRYAHLASSTLADLAAATQPTPSPREGENPSLSAALGDDFLASGGSRESARKTLGYKRSWTPRGLRGRIREALEAIRARRPDALTRCEEVAREVELARREADPVLRALDAARSAGPHALDRYIEAFDAALGESWTAYSGSAKRGAR